MNDSSHALITLVYVDGVFVPLTPLAESDIENGTQIAFRWPDDVYLCESDRQAALDQGKVVQLETREDND
jgi:hypothetical protein